MTDVALSLILVAVALVVSRLYRLQLERELMIAVVRALVQLSAIAAVIHVVLDSLGPSGVLLAVMVAAAAWTSGRRLKGVPRAYVLSAEAIALSAAVALGVLFGTGVFPFGPRWLIPIAGMLIGNAMTATSLAGGRLRDEIVDKRLEIEARLALGVTPAEALGEYVRRSAVTSLIPTLDATKNVGLIFLPGAFVGMILAGRSPADAAEVQFIVLFMLLGAVAVSGMLATYLVGRAFVGPGARVVLPPSLES